MTPKQALAKGENKLDADVILLLRKIRDTAWQYGRCHERFPRIEQMAEKALEILDIVDGPPYPNPRSPNWWVKH